MTRVPLTSPIITPEPLYMPWAAPDFDSILSVFNMHPRFLLSSVSLTGFYASNA